MLSDKALGSPLDSWELHQICHTVAPLMAGRESVVGEPGGNALIGKALSSQLDSLELHWIDLTEAPFKAGKGNARRGPDKAMLS